MKRIVLSALSCVTLLGVTACGGEVEEEEEVGVVEPMMAEEGMVEEGLGEEGLGEEGLGEEGLGEEGLAE